MNSKLNELNLQRGRLLERIASQRSALRYDAQPACQALSKVDRALGRVQAVTNYVKQHPGLMALAIPALFFIKKGRVWSWAKRGFVTWQTWRTVRDRLSAFGGHGPL